MDDKALIEWILQSDTLDVNNTTVSPTVPSFTGTSSSCIGDAPLLNLIHDDRTTFDIAKETATQATSAPFISTQRQSNLPKHAPKGVPQENATVLDFRRVAEQVPEAQLKAMTSKERRQLRNKISARNFRNRRKEYITSLEDQVDQQNAEISRLRLEIKWAKENIDALKKENDSLKLELIVVKKQASTVDQFTSSPLDMPSLAVTTSSLSSQSSPPNLFDLSMDDWIFTVPEETHLSHAVIPHWDFSSILSKEQAINPATPNMLFRRFPLLAPALMSIVLSHTMTMTTEELLAAARLASSQKTWTIEDSRDFHTKHMPGLSAKEMKNVWDILQPRQNLIENVKEEEFHDSIETPEENKKASEPQAKAEVVSFELPYCPIGWIQQTFFRLVCAAMMEYQQTNRHWSDKIPIPICDRFRRKVRSTE
ncbi:hypothetical protein EC973_006206 [Apophysomyces ossiformis]|uniref:BZIP domain-containing protein n=1 Tax=Apophysomyces ossiformis TaxID=679940 RepID=A0A8H7BRF7_9FUNG|nr:hypothetical protein EC973_006206 [Apophysomyces ossiformis]